MLQEAVDAEVKKLLAFKAEYKNKTGKDWKPGQAPVAAAPAPSAPAGSGNADDLNDKITEQGNIIRKLKTDKAPKVSCGVWFTDHCQSRILYFVLLFLFGHICCGALDS